MGQAEKRAAADQKRLDLILQSIKDGMSAKALAARIGVEEDYAKRLRKQVATQHGLTVVEGETPILPYGLTDASKSARAKLKDLLVNLNERRGMHAIEIAIEIGISEKAQTKNNGRGAVGHNAHDWKLSELERLAKAYNMTFIQLLQHLTGDKF